MTGHEPLEKQDLKVSRLRLWAVLQPGVLTRARPPERALRATVCSSWRLKVKLVVSAPESARKHSSRG